MIGFVFFSFKVSENTMLSDLTLGAIDLLSSLFFAGSVTAKHRLIIYTTTVCGFSSLTTASIFSRAIYSTQVPSMMDTLSHLHLSEVRPSYILTSLSLSLLDNVLLLDTLYC